MPVPRQRIAVMRQHGPRKVTAAIDAGDTAKANHYWGCYLVRRFKRLRKCRK